MKKFTYLLICLFLTSTFLKAEIIHIDYGDGLEIPMNANYPIDLNGDGLPEFSINKKVDEFGIYSHSESACVTGHPFDFSDFDTRLLYTFEEGELISSYAALDRGIAYLEDETGSTYHTHHGFVEGWSDKEFKYVGFMYFEKYGSFIYDGWMKIGVDLDKDAFVIKQIAYDASETHGIMAGRISTSVTDLAGTLKFMGANPNPSSSQSTLIFELENESDMEIFLINPIGQKMDFNYSALKPGLNNIEIQTGHLPDGMHLVVFANGKGVHTEKLMIQH